MIEVVEIGQSIQAIRQIAASQFRNDKRVDAELVSLDKALQFCFEATPAKQIDPDGSISEYHSLSTVNLGEACARL